MPKLLKLLTAILVVLPLVVLAAESKTVALDVQNMTCELCPLAVKKALEKVPGVSAVQVDFATKTATVTYDPEQAQPQMLIQATTDAGYPSTLKE